MHYIWNKHIPKKIRASFIQLLLHIHLDSKPRSEKIIPLLTKKILLDEKKY